MLTPEQIDSRMESMKSTLDDLVIVAANRNDSIESRLCSLVKIQWKLLLEIANQAKARGA